uniref:BTB domain-containing protein n=1 Tax=Panagrellus redivivus TaxID=6233 RepID=A0A7E4VUG3_PANRE
MGESLLNLTNTTLGELILQEERFEVVINLSGDELEDLYALPREHFECDNLPFKDLPYEFRTRLVVLLPPRDCVSFKLTGKPATEYVKKRGQFSAFLLVGGNSNSYADMKTFGSKKPDYDITSTSFFLKSDNWYIKTGLYLNLNSTEKFDHAVKIVSGTYRSLQLDGPYTWKHAIHFMNLSNKIEDVILHDGMLLELEDFNDFFEAVVRYCKHQENATIIIIRCPHLTEAFTPQFKEYVENRTTFAVRFSGGETVVYQSCPQNIESLTY